MALFVSLFLPWYQRHFFVDVAGKLQPAADSQTGWAAFSFVEAAVLLVAAGVLTLLFQRAEGRAFHIPGGDGGVIMAAGGWTCVLVIWRIFDKQGATSHGQFATTSGIEWGIFAALAVAAFLTYSGTRIRAAHQPEPPLPGEQPNAGSPPSDPGRPSAAPRRADRPARADRQPTRSWSAADEDDAPTVRVGSPATPAGASSRPVRAPAPRRDPKPDDQLKIPLDRDQD
jgi:hypothetical protein